MMDEMTAQELGKALLDGFFKGLGQSSETIYTLTVGADVRGEGDLALLLSEYPILLRVEWSKPEVCLVLLFKLDDAQRISGSDVTEPNLEPSAVEVLAQAAQEGFGSALAQAGLGEVSSAEVFVESSSDWTTESLLEEFGGSLSLVDIGFEDEVGTSGQAVLALDDRMGAFPAARGSAMPTLSNEELQDILGGDDLSAMAEESPIVSESRSKSPGNIDMVLDIRLLATARLGRIEMPISEILELGPGSIVEVGHLVDEPVDLLINDKLIARGDVVVVDEKFGLRITEIISPRERIESLR